MKYLSEESILANRYRITEFISKGAMGAVYKAFDIRLKCNVAVKQNLLDINISEQRFRREAELLANLKHIGLPKVTDYFFYDNAYYLVMELVEGPDLNESVISKEVFTYEKGLHFFERLLDILIYLHSFNIIHADIKPSNLKIDNQENDIKLLDFGIAKGTIGQVTRDPNSGGGTLLYMPIEQTGIFELDNKVTIQSDIFSASATFFHLFTGIEPIPSFQRFLIYNKEAIDPQKLISDFIPDFPRSVAEIIHNGLALLPKDRIQTANEMKLFLQQKKGDKQKKYTKWPNEKRHNKIPASFIIPVGEGMTLMDIVRESGELESILYYFDRTPFIYKLSEIKPFRLNLKPILYQTAYGYILCLFFYVPNPQNPEMDFFSSENYVNLYDPNVLGQFFQLARQSHWHLYLVQAEKREVVNVFEFENTFDLEKTLNKAVSLTRNAPRGDFMKAKKEFMDTFTMDDLFRMY